MTRDEVKQIVFVIVQTYPNFKCDDLSKTVDAWYFFLADYDYNKIAIALKAFVNTSGSAFPPSVPQLIEMVNKPKDLVQMNEMEAWSYVRKAISNSTYNSEKEFEKLGRISSEIQKAVGSPSQLYAWATDDDFNESVVSSNFQRAYRTMVERQREFERMPIEMKSQVQELQSRTLAMLEAKK